MKWLTHKIRILVLVVPCALVCNQASAEEMLTSAEIKKIRFLSKALLKSRANEKKRLQTEIKPLREQIKTMQVALDPLMQINPNNKFVAQEMTKSNTAFIQTSELTRSNTAQSTNSAKVNSQKEQTESKLNTKTKSNIANARSRIKATKLAAEKNLPKLWEFWKTETAQDKRNQQIANMAKVVDDELAVMEQTGEIDREKIKALKQRISLKRPQVSITDIEPTFRTITKHRK